MKVVFAGPSIWGLDLDASGIVMRGPAAAGDIKHAVDEGAEIIGLIDGFFGWQAAVWHKEILFAISEGVAVYGAASMGALRAAEMYTVGMIPVGGIALDYISGALDDDAAVALTSSPAELSYMPLSEPLVDAVATIENMHRHDAITSSARSRLLLSAQMLFFQRRTAEEIVGLTFKNEVARQKHIALYERYRVSRKRDDAGELISIVRTSSHTRSKQSNFEPSPFWQLLRSTNV